MITGGWPCMEDGSNFSRRSKNGTDSGTGRGVTILRCGVSTRGTSRGVSEYFLWCAVMQALLGVQWLCAVKVARFDGPVHSPREGVADLRLHVAAGGEVLHRLHERRRLPPQRCSNHSRSRGTSSEYRLYSERYALFSGSFSRCP